MTARGPRSALLVADSGPLIVLGLAGLLPLVAQRHGPLAVPEAVLAECTATPGLPGEPSIRTALASGHLRAVMALELLADAQSLRGLGHGELAVLAYAQQHRLTALVDDRKARQVAQRLGLSIMGSGAILVDLKRAGMVASVGEVLASWAAHGYFVSEALRAALLAAAGE